MNRGAYTIVCNDFFDKYLNKLSPAAVKVFLVVDRKTEGWHKKVDRISISQFEQYTGLTKPTILRAIKELIEERLIEEEKFLLDGVLVKQYRIVYDEVKEEEKKDVVLPYEQIDQNPEPGETEGAKKIHSENELPRPVALTRKYEETDGVGRIGKDNELVGIEEIPKELRGLARAHGEMVKDAMKVIDLLNYHSEKSFKQTAYNVRLVLRWLKEGYKVADFERVIIAKCIDWMNNPDMRPYVRPQTLFGNKFESYANEALVKPWKPKVLVFDGKGQDNRNSGDTRQMITEEERERRMRYSILWRGY